MAEVIPAGAFDHELVEWDAWSPVEAAQRLAGITAPWYVAAGWAIDLFLGAQRREHEDLEIAVPADRFPEVASALSDFDLFVSGPNPVARPDADGGIATPLAEAGALLETVHQTWVLDRSAGRWRLDIFREPSDGETWICRRDERIRLPHDRVIEHTESGIPFGAPEIVLLFKAKHARRKDDDDFAAVVPFLGEDRLGWLVTALEQVHPGHRWLEELKRR